MKSGEKTEQETVSKPSKKIIVETREHPSLTPMKINHSAKNIIESSLQNRKKGKNAVSISLFSEVAVQTGFFSR